ncbi:MAG TPA: F0F1 ATP synthase subunit A [Gemmatimonadales bacterium]|nr:F0F1 ATP synthase subunit A [Gemmatimonadales bacterium]
MMQTPDIGRMILERTGDSHTLELPFGGEIHLPHWPVHVGRLTIDLGPTRLSVFLVLAAVLVFLTLWLAGRALTRRRDQGGGAPRGLASLVEVVVLFVRNDVAIASIGHKNGARFAPYILTLFWFILYCNLLGLIPYGEKPTSSFWVTGALALTALLTIEISGFVTLGPKGYLKTIVFTPPGTTGITAVLLTLIMIPIEIIGKIVKPFALMLRLFANMVAGHFVILSLLSLIFLFGGIHYFRWAIAGGSVAFVLFMMAIELLVAFIQAYIFALLTATFIGLMQHEH